MLFTVVGSGFVALGLAIGWYGIRPLAVVPRVSSVPPSETQVTNTGSFVVCCGIADESASRALTTPFTGSRCLGFEFEITERQPFGIRIPWFQAYLDGGVATRPFTLNGPAGTLDVVPSAKRFALDTESTVITVGGSETPPERIQRFVDVRDELEPVARWVRIIPGLGTRRYVERRIAPGEEYLIAGHTERQQNGSSWRVISSSPIAPRDGSRSHGSGGQCSRRWSRWLSSLSESEASPYDRLRYEPDYPSVTMTRDTDAIETRELTKRFGTEIAVDGLNLTVDHGTVYGFLGPNGAGKTTTMRMLTSLTRPTDGEAWINRNPVSDRDAIRASIGIFPRNRRF